VDTDMDMDMAVDYAEPSPQRPLPTGHSHLAPRSFQPDPAVSSITVRMPTPIQPSFAAQARGNNWSGAAGNVMLAGVGPVQHSSRASLRSAFGLNGAGGSCMAAQLSGDSSIPRSLDHMGMTEWHGQTRPLPSPISESGGEDMGSPDMVLDGFQNRSNSIDNSHSLPPRSHSVLSLPTAFPEARTGADGALGPADGGHDGGKLGATNPVSAMDADTPATPSPKKGHTRSRHTLNSWTLQPGMKKSFSIGYRADCEKCRNKVPGHFNHIIVS